MVKHLDWHLDWHLELGLEIELEQPWLLCKGIKMLVRPCKWMSVQIPNQKLTLWGRFWSRGCSRHACGKCRRFRGWFRCGLGGWFRCGLRCRCSCWFRCWLRCWLRGRRGSWLKSWLKSWFRSGFRSWLFSWLCRGLKGGFCGGFKSRWPSRKWCRLWSWKRRWRTCVDSLSGYRCRGTRHDQPSWCDRGGRRGAFIHRWNLGTIAITSRAFVPTRLIYTASLSTVTTSEATVCDTVWTSHLANVYRNVYQNVWEGLRQKVLRVRHIWSKCFLPYPFPLPIFSDGRKKGACVRVMIVTAFGSRWLLRGVTTKGRTIHVLCFPKLTLSFAVKSTLTLALAIIALGVTSLLKRIR